MDLRPWCSPYCIEMLEKGFSYVAIHGAFFATPAWRLLGPSVAGQPTFSQYIEASHALLTSVVFEPVVTCAAAKELLNLVSISSFQDGTRKRTYLNERLRIFPTFILASAPSVHLPSKLVHRRCVIFVQEKRE